ncbi:lipopolysaccharide biosynthesis protein [Azohydromonas australica]|uniref:lipopolysaccharide biosynthesis protein n=1 Tax=Azohydromonas australica TaxID=364039 RepID=UPI00040E7D1B|nr:lipopolysaccharide biosynthesis protein [Azohydromonas australica]
MNAPLSSVNRSIATGALWLVVFKFAERGIGLVSTLILARLLLPADFGLVAMAMTLLAVLELIGNFGFDHAIIRKPDADRLHYDTAWTLTVMHGLLSGLVLVALAIPLAGFFNEPRLKSVIYVLALIAAVQGLQNIGLVMFRKQMQFRQDVTFFLVKKVVAFVATMWLAFTFRNYWALVGGTLVSRVTGVVISFMMHPYRPRLCFKATRDLLGFSRWIMVNGLLGYLIERGPDYLIGRLAGATSLGVFRVAHEVSQLPTSELLFPIMRAAYPGYSLVARDAEKLKATYLSVQEAVLLLTLPAAVGVIVLAEPLVLALLGPKWIDAIPVVRVLGVYGAIKMFQSTNNAIFNVLGKPYVNTVLAALECVIVLPLLALLLSHGLATAAWSYLAALAVAVPTAMALLSRQLGLRAAERVRVTWRPLLATGVMAAALEMAQPALGLVSSTSNAVIALATLIPGGAIVYAGTVFVLWYAAGKPPSAEYRFITATTARVRRMRPM